MIRRAARAVTGAVRRAARAVLPSRFGGGGGGGRSSGT